MSERMRVWSTAGYYVCSHQACAKKCRFTHEDGHDCCGKHDHRTVADLYAARAQFVALWKSTRKPRWWRR